MSILSDRDVALMQVVFRNLTGDISDLVNFENVAKQYGYKDKSNARTCFRRLIQKISDADGGGATTKSAPKKRGLDVMEEGEAEDGDITTSKPAKKTRTATKKTASSKKVAVKQKDNKLESKVAVDQKDNEFESVDAEVDIKQEPESGEVDEYA